MNKPLGADKNLEKILPDSELEALTGEEARAVITEIKKPIKIRSEQHLNLTCKTKNEIKYMLRCLFCMIFL